MQADAYEGNADILQFGFICPAGLTARSVATETLDHQKHQSKKETMFPVKTAGCVNYRELKIPGLNIESCENN